jgi:anti-sigma B factor antagonist
MQVTDRGIIHGTIVALDGEFDLAQRHRILDAFAAVSNESLVVVDLERAGYIDSTVLSSLIRMRNEITERGGALIVTTPRPMVKRLFEIAGLNEVFDIRSTLAEVREEYGLFDGTLRRVEVVADVID